jgi:hypothetical protein
MYKCSIHITEHNYINFIIIIIILVISKKKKKIDYLNSKHTFKKKIKKSIDC